MKEIKFNDEMFQALLDGRKTQTRRPVGAETEEVIRLHAGEADDPCGEAEVEFIYGQFCDDDGELSESQWLVRAYEIPEEGVIPMGQCPYGMTGERVAATCGGQSIELEITRVQVERLQDIGAHDALLEGIEDVWSHRHGGTFSQQEMADMQAAFKGVWDSIYGQLSWPANPWVWVIEFKRVDE